jgi:tRNA threonylcarbamoyladenosine biosynthesis protein TsaB
MRILALDTATEACSAALWVAGEVRERFAVEPRRHGALILGMMEDLLSEAGLALGDLDAIAFGRGPGSFTGVRIATGVAQGAALGAGLPVLPVSTLAALAQGQFRRHGLGATLAAFDARMGEVYWGAYRVDAGGVARGVGSEQVGTPQAVRLPAGGPWHGAGSGWAAHGEALRARLGPALAGVDPEASCRAQDVARLAAADLAEGRAVAAEAALPVYLRDRVTSGAGTGRGGGPGAGEAQD